jgi:protein tyrosine phosphatase (PTP) superfamily phosphohydrolase (DUF442 family)
MMKRSLPFLILLALFPLPLSSQTIPQTPSLPTMESAYGQKLRITGIPNAGRIKDLLYRGGQPKEQGLTQLKALGVTTIVDLRSEDAEKIAWERKRAESLGIRFVHIPVSGWSPPTNEQVIQFLSLFRDKPEQKLFVHCRFGDDRTGVFLAIYRMAIDKWPAEQALKEMYFFGFNGFWHPSMKIFIREFPARLKSTPSLARLTLTLAQP